MPNNEDRNPLDRFFNIALTPKGATLFGGISALGTGIALQTYSSIEEYSGLVHGVGIALICFGTVLVLASLTYLILPLVLPLYAATDGRTMRRHIEGRVKGMLYDPLGALYCYRDAITALDNEDQRLQ